MERDELLRSRCFLALDVLRARFGDDLPRPGALDEGFIADGHRVPFANFQKGIYRAAAQRGRAALSIVTSHDRPYADEATDDGLWYAYRAGDPDQADNRALREAAHLRVPLVYFMAMRANWYRAEYPCYVMEDDLYARRVRVTFGQMRDREPLLPEDPIERRYRTGRALIRLHQARFRAVVLPAYRDRCAVCRLREIRLLDAAHIVQDRDPRGVAAVTNGVSLCTIHHRAFDHDLVGIDPDYRVHVAQRLREDEDGPMLTLLQGSHGARIEIPRAPARRPNRELLAERFERFSAA